MLPFAIFEVHSITTFAKYKLIESVLLGYLITTLDTMKFNSVREKLQLLTSFFNIPRNLSNNGNSIQYLYGVPRDHKMLTCFEI